MPRIKTAHACLWFLLLAAFVFSDFLFFGKNLIGNLDVADINLPALLAAKRAFVEGGWGLWNPYLSAGTSLFSNAIAPQFYPENWILFWLPEEWFFTAVTLVSFLKFWCIGLLAFAWFRKEGGNPGWAIFAATVFQLCGFSLWTVISSDSLSLQFYFTLACALIWTADSRSRTGNFFWIWLTLVQIFYCSNYVYAAYVLAMIVLLFAYRWRLTSQWLAFSPALLSATLLAMPRLLPSWAELGASSRSVGSFFYEMASLPFLSLRLFVPEIFGVSYWASFNTIGELSSVYKAMSVQTFANFPHYFGAVPVLLLLTGLNLLRDDRRLRWLYAAVAFPLVILLALEPLNTILRELMFPFFHLQSVHFLLAPVFCLLLLHVGTKIEEVKPTLPWWVGGAVAFVILYAAAVWSLNFQGDWNVSLLAKAGVAAAFLLFTIRQHLSVRICSALVFVGALAFVLLGSASAIHGSHLRILATSLAVLGALGATGFRAKPGFTVLLVAVVAAASLMFAARETLFLLATKGESASIAALGTIKFVLVAALFASSYRRSETPVLRTCFCLLLFELLPAAKINSHLVMNPFFTGASPFPVRESRLSLSLEDYRVNNPNTFTATPLYRAMYEDKETISAVHTAYGVRSYGGYVNSVPARYSSLVDSFSTGAIYDGGKRGYPATFSDPRFLDLMGVGYDYQPKAKTLRHRPTALTRFSFFDSFEVIPDEKRALARLREPGFDPQQVVLLERPPEFASRVPSAAQSVAYRSRGSDLLKLELSAPTNGILLFNDSFHSGWRVKVNGESRPLLRANHAFMGIALSSGKNEIQLEFLPAPFVEGLELGRWGLALFAFFLVLLKCGEWLVPKFRYIPPTGIEPVIRD